MHLSRIGSGVASVTLAAVPMLAMAQSDGHGVHLACCRSGAAAPGTTCVSGQ